MGDVPVWGGHSSLFIKNAVNMLALNQQWYILAAQAGKVDNMSPTIIQCRNMPIATSKDAKNLCMPQLQSASSFKSMSF